MTIGAMLFAAWAFLASLGALLVLTAPHGWEDRDGFHLGEPDE